MVHNTKSLIKTAQEIEYLTKSGEILSKARAEVVAAVRAGITPLELDKIAEEAITRLGGRPAFLGYKPEGAKKAYPNTLCVSANEVIVHGVPNDVPLRNGDIVSVDIGAIYKGYYSDSAVTVAVGTPTPEIKKLITVTKEALVRGIAAAKPGNTLGDIGHAINSHVRKNGFFIVKGLTGHGIGTELHEDPRVYNEGELGQGMKLEPGMVLALEPMVAVSTTKIVQLPDEGYGTSDGSLSAHFEHTVLITEKGNKVLTQ